MAGVRGTLPRCCFKAADMRLDHINIATDDLDGSIAFYRDVLGLAVGPRGLNSGSKSCPRAVTGVTRVTALDDGPGWINRVQSDRSCRPRRSRMVGKVL